MSDITRVESSDVEIPQAKYFVEVTVAREKGDLIELDIDIVKDYLESLGLDIKQIGETKGPITNLSSRNKAIIVQEILHSLDKPTDIVKQNRENLVSLVGTLSE